MRLDHLKQELKCHCNEGWHGIILSILAVQGLVLR
jgi:hypothetical protein